MPCRCRCRTNLWLANHPLNNPPAAEPLGVPFPLQPDISVAPHTDSRAAINWLVVVTAFYACVAGLLVLRLAVGLCLTWRIARAATPIREPWTADWRVRISDAVGGPVTFGSTILLPPHYVDWDLQKRRAVLAHEGAHVVNRDFHVLLLASLNRAVFWFSPFAWWQLTRLAELAEIISDASALEVLEDRLSYAEILLDLARRARPAPSGLAMARACTVRARVERICGNRRPCEARLAPANLGGRSHSAGCRGFRRQHCLHHGASAGDRQHGRCGDGDAQAGAGCVLFIGPDLDLCHLPGRQRALWATQRATQSPAGCGGRRDLFLPAADGQMSWAVSNEQPPSELVLNQNGRELRAVRVAELSGQGVESDDASRLDAYVGAYALAPTRVLSVTRDGDRLHVRETGRPRFEVTARGVDAFAGTAGDLVIFLRDGPTKVAQVLLQEPLSGARLAPRISAARAKLMEEEFARRIAEVPDRFREQAPLPGGKEAILRGIDDLQRGTPNYERMSTSLAAKKQRRKPDCRCEKTGGPSGCPASKNGRRRPPRRTGKDSCGRA